MVKRALVKSFLVFFFHLLKLSFLCSGVFLIDVPILSDINKLGGLVAVTKELNHSDPVIRTLAAWVLGKASQNNPIVQQQVFFNVNGISLALRHLQS